MKLNKKTSASLFTVAAAAIAATGLAPRADAAFILTGWDLAGDIGTGQWQGRDVAIVTTAHSTMEFGADAINVSGSDPYLAGGDLEDFLVAPIGSLDRDVLDQATEGSAMKFTITVAVGDTLTFDWNLLTHDAMGLDYAFFMIDGVIVDTLSSATASLPTSGTFGNETGFATMSHQFTTAGQVELAFGVVDITDYAGTSTLMLGNLAIPEPSAALLGALGLLPLLRRRR